MKAPVSWRCFWLIVLAIKSHCFQYLEFKPSSQIHASCWWFVLCLIMQRFHSTAAIVNHTFTHLFAVLLCVAICIFFLQQQQLKSRVPLTLTSNVWPCKMHQKHSFVVGSIPWFCNRGLDTNFCFKFYINLYNDSWTWHEAHRYVWVSNV